MKIPMYLFLLLAAATIASASSFTARPLEGGFGVGTTVWRFSSALSKESRGVVEFCYIEEGSAERVLGRIDVRPFRSSEEQMPDLRILFTKATVEGKQNVVLVVGYGLRSGAFVVDVPGLTSHSLVESGTPQASPSGEFTLLGFGDGSVTVKSGGMEGLRGRLYFRYTPSA